jgi:hypothetical protein
MALNPLTWLDIWAYFQLTGFSPAQWELSAIKQLDAAYLQFSAEK